MAHPRPKAGPSLPEGARAWLLLDVDGVINVLCSRAEARRRGLSRIEAPSPDSTWTYTLQVIPWVGEAVKGLAGLAPAWCTTWMDSVDGPGRPASISCAAGLPLGLPWVDLRYYTNSRRHSKVPGISAFVGKAPFVWIDDAPLPGDVKALGRLRGPNLLIPISPAEGLRRGDLEQAATWVAGLAARAPGEGSPRRAPR